VSNPDDLLGQTVLIHESQGVGKTAKVNALRYGSFDRVWAEVIMPNGEYVWKRRSDFSTEEELRQRLVANV
jgi:hypothetical protein